MRLALPQGLLGTPLGQPNGHAVRPPLQKVNTFRAEPSRPAVIQTDQTEGLLLCP